MIIRWKALLAAVLASALSGFIAKSQPYGLTNAVPVGGFLNGIFPSSAPNSGATFDVEVAYTNLSPFNLPIYMTAHPLTNAMVLIEKNGRIRMFPNRRDVSNAEVTTILDLSSKVFTVSDSGMTGIAFHPQFGQARFYESRFRLSHLQMAAESRRGRKCRLLLLAALALHRARRTIHHRSQFRDDSRPTIRSTGVPRRRLHDVRPGRLLYFSCGDEGGADDQYHASQKLNERLMSGIFRVDVNMNPATSHRSRRQPFQHPAQPPTWPLSYTSNYFVPNDNPFLDPAGSVLEEYYALGLRNPYRFSRDPGHRHDLDR